MLVAQHREQFMISVAAQEITFLAHVLHDDSSFFLSSQDVGVCSPVPRTGTRFFR